MEANKIIFPVKRERFPNYILWTWLATRINSNGNNFLESLMLIYMQKLTWSLSSFLIYYTLKILPIWLARGILVHTLRNRLLPDKGLAVKYMTFHFRLFPGKSNEQMFQNNERSILGQKRKFLKTLFWSGFF